MTMQGWFDSLRRMVGDPGTIPGDTGGAVPDDAPQAPPAPNALVHDLGTHGCTAVLLNGIACLVEVTTWDKPTVQVTFEGSDRRKAELRVRGRGPGSVLSIEDTSVGHGITVSNLRGGNVVVGNMSVSADSNSSISVSGNGCSINMSGGRITVNGVDMTDKMQGGASVSQEPPARLLVRVPVGMALSLEDMRGETTIGDVCGNLTVYSAGMSHLHAGKVRGLEVTIAGSSRVEVAHVDGPCQVTISGSGRVRCRGGRTSKLYASISGSGHVRFDGTATEADLSITGSGEIDVFRVVERLRKRKTGSGAITVGSTGPNVERF